MVAKVFSLFGWREPEVIATPDLVDDAPSSPRFHWLVSYRPGAGPMAEQCVCHLEFDHDEVGQAADQ